jgi:hypothetical protein
MQKVVRLVSLVLRLASPSVADLQATPESEGVPISQSVSKITRKGCKRQATALQIINWGPPESLQMYFQMVGRAGRDMLPARCILFWSAKNVATRRFLQRQQHCAHDVECYSKEDLCTLCPLHEYVCIIDHMCMSLVRSSLIKSGASSNAYDPKHLVNHACTILTYGPCSGRIYCASAVDFVPSAVFNFASQLCLWSKRKSCLGLCLLLASHHV